jgi:hypothetical protein
MKGSAILNPFTVFRGPVIMRFVGPIGCTPSVIPVNKPAFAAYLN